MVQRLKTAAQGTAALRAIYRTLISNLGHYPARHTDSLIVCIFQCVYINMIMSKVSKISCLRPKHKTYSYSQRETTELKPLLAVRHSWCLWLFL